MFQCDVTEAPGSSSKDILEVKAENEAKSSQK